MSGNMFRDMLEQANAQAQEPGNPFIPAETRRITEQRVLKEAEENPAGLGAVDRAGLSIKMAPSAKLDFLVKHLDAKYGEGEGKRRVFQGEGGVLGFFDEENKPRLVDRPVNRGQALLMASMPVLGMFGAIPLGIMAERLSKGAVKETAGDVADVAGEALELAPDVAAEYVSRRAGLPLFSRMSAQGLGAGTGSLIRRGVSEMLPGEEPGGAKETAQRAATNAVVGAAPSLFVDTVPKVVPFSKKSPTVVDEWQAKRLFEGSVADPNVQKVLEAERKTGVVLPPDAVTLNLNAVKRSDALRQLPDTAEEMFQRNLANVEATGNFLQKRADALLGSKVPSETVGETIHSDLVEYYNKGDRERKAAWKAGMAPIVEEFGKVTPIATKNATLARNELVAQGIDPGAMPEKASLEELTNRISNYGKDAMSGALGADRSRAQFIAAKMKDAVMKDIEQGLGPKLAEDFSAVRSQYRKMSEVLDSREIDLISNVLNKGSKEKIAFEQIPTAILAKNIPRRQIEVLFSILDKAAPTSANKLRRSVFDEVVDKAAASGKSLEGKRLAIEGERLPEGASVPTPSGLTATAIRDNLDTLDTILPKEMRSDLRTALDLYERIDLTSRTAKGSQTASLLSAAGMKGALLNTLARAPRKRLARMLADKETRDMLIGINKDWPKNADARTTLTALTRFAKLAGSENAEESGMDIDKELADQ